MKAKKTRIIIITSLILVVLLFLLGFFTVKGIQLKTEKQRQELLEQKEKLKQEIISSYGLFVKTNKDSNIYQKNENEYKKIGKVSENIELELENLETITEETLYFKLKNLDYYISYKDVEKIESLTPTRDDYKNYLLFNMNVKTTNETKLYQDERLVYHIFNEIDLPIIINKTDKYYVEYDNKLLYLKSYEVTTYEKINTELEEAQSFATITYHFIYDKTTTTCNQTICHDITQFDSHMKYIKENGFYALRMNDLELFLDGAIRLPKKSVVITIDDGWYVENAIPILEKYQLNATVFLITRAYSYDMFPSEYLEKHSHSNDLHEPGVCSGGQGGGIKCLPRENILKDLAISREKTNGSKVFCYPFYEYNNYAISLLQEAGFTMAFKGGATKVNKNTNKMLIPRYTLVYNSTVNDLARIIN